MFYKFTSISSKWKETNVNFVNLKNVLISYRLKLLKNGRLKITEN